MDGQTTYYNTILQAGGTVIDGDTSGYASEGSQAGIQFWTVLIANGGSPSIQQLTDTTADQWFTSGKLAMYWGGSWFRSALTDLPFSGDITALPLPQGEEQATVIHGVSNVVSASSKNKQAAQAFKKAGMVNVALKLYPDCRHEILNELNKQEVYEDITGWITKVTELG